MLETRNDDSESQRTSRSSIVRQQNQIADMDRSHLSWRELLSRSQPTLASLLLSNFTEIETIKIMDGITLIKNCVAVIFVSAFIVIMMIDVEFKNN